MKKHLLLLAFALVAALSAIGQHTVPQGIKFQAAARDLNGKLLANQSANLQVSLVSNGKVFYAENHLPTTNDLGLFEVTVGSGKTVAGDFSQIPWATTEIWLEIKMAAAGSNDYQIVSSSRLLAVPYAFHAGTAGGIVNGATNEPLPEACAPGSVTGTLWGTKGNCATAPGSKLGPVDYKPLVIVTDNTERVLVASNGNFTARQEGQFDKTLTADGAITGHSTLTIDGDASITNEHVKILNDPSGDGTSIGGYGVQINNYSQGLAIQLKDNLNLEQRFLGCFDKAGNVKGSISGITSGEFANLSSTQRETALFTLKIIQITANLVALVAEGVAAAGEIFTGAAEVVAVAAQGVAWGIELAAFIIEETNYSAEKNAATAGGTGITLNSGNGDYAEWLERANPAEDLSYGQIVGIKAGKISLETKGADHVMVVSMAPIVLGNMPPEGREADFEKVAFVGQVPVRLVGGARVGDFVIASGNADGLAIAVPKEKMKIEDYARIIGVAWEASDDEFFGFINVAVGINANDLADKMAIQAREIEQAKAKMADLESKIAKIEAFLSGKTQTLDLGTQPAAVAAMAAPAAGSTNGARGGDEEPPVDPSFYYSDEYLESIRPQLEAGMKKYADMLAANEISLEQLPEEAQLMFNDPVQGLKKLQSGAFGQTVLDDVKRKRADRH